MAKWPTWLKVLLAVVGVSALVAISQVVLYLDKMGASKFDL